MPSLVDVLAPLVVVESLVVMLRVLDLFSGIGGFSLGLERAGMRTVAFCEIDPYCRAVLRKHWPGVPIFEDVRNLRAEHVGPVDLICGGFPCQDISTAGRGAGLAGERSGLWSEYRRLIEEIRPAWVVIENVSALRSRGLDQVLGEISALGYDAEWHCIPASAVGAPHRRDRVWIVAHANLDPRLARRAGDADEGQGGRDVGGSTVGQDVAYPVLGAVRAGLRQPDEAQQRDQLGDGCSVVADAERERVPHDGPGSAHRETRAMQGDRKERQRLRIDLGQCADDGRGIWSSEPDVGRVANGVPSRVDRLRSLGNAVVPQIPEIIGRAIMTATAESRNK